MLCFYIEIGILSVWFAAWAVAFIALAISDIRKIAKGDYEYRPY